jgi:Protein of unknown function (Hypoth_ymh)
MARPRILDRKLMEKVAKKAGKKDITSVNGMVSRMANQQGISPEAALVVLAKKYGIGAATYQSRLNADKQSQIRGVLPTLFTPRSRDNFKNAADTRTTRASLNPRAALKSAIEYLIQDQELRERCQNDLMARKHFDKPINQATLVLEERIRGKVQDAQRLVGETLVSYAFNEDLSKTRLQVATNNPDDQRGFTQILRGFVPAFRNKTHHFITKNLSREEAMRVCGFIDVLLRIVDSSVKIR